MQKHFIITGASKGIGRQTALSLAGRGHMITAVARSGSALTSLKREYSSHIQTLKLDITDPGSVGKLSALLKKDNSKIDGFVHNAGLLINKPFLEQTDEDWQNQIEVNLLAVVRWTRELIPYFNKGSHILNISSMGGYQGSSKFPGLSAYSVSKGALSVLGECLAVELAEFQIAVNTLCLGAVRTEMLDQAFPGLEAPVSAEEMGSYVAHFIQEGHRFYNGKILPVALSDPG